MICSSCPILWILISFGHSGMVGRSLWSRDRSNWHCFSYT